MKFIGKLLLTLLLLIVLAVVVLYGGANSLGGRPPERLDQRQQRIPPVDRKNHPFVEPAGPDRSGRRAAGAQRPAAGAGRQPRRSGLSLRQITEPRYFHSVTLRDGTLNVQPQAAALPVQADVLQLSNMALQSNDSKWQLNAQQVTAGITPWRPLAGHLLGTITSSSSAPVR